MFPDPAAPPPGTDIRIDPSTARPRPYRGVLGELYRWIGWLYFKIFGWTLIGDWPAYPKAVAIGAPHTTNLDGPLLIAAMGWYRVRMFWMGKASLTQGPLGGLVRWMGCIPIDRSKNSDMVGQMVKRFAESDRLILGVPPEGTRTPGTPWKSGFYHIARAANVPIIFCVLDWGRRQVGVVGAFMPTGDYEADMAVIKAHYVGVRGKFTPV
jgi:1-acyl-sn-glycerol-3-phosphate acyltransferase